MTHDKLCACGARYTPPQWEALPFVGMQHAVADDEGDEEHLELRNCTACLSTLAVTIPPGCPHCGAPDGEAVVDDETGETRCTRCVPEVERW